MKNLITVFLLYISFSATTQMNSQEFLEENQEIQQEKQDHINSYLQMHPNAILKSENTLLWDVTDINPIYIEDYNAETRKATRTIFLAPNGGSPEPDHPELVMNEGRMFATTNDDIIVTDGPFFRSPFQDNTNVTCFIPEDYFVGEYTVGQISKQQNAFAGSAGPAFSEAEQTVTVERNGTQRIFTYTYFPESFASEITITLDLICGEVFVTGTGSNLSCDTNISFIGQSTPEVPSTYSVENDIEILLDLIDFEPDGGCGTGGYPVTLKFTKQNLSNTKFESNSISFWPNPVDNNLNITAKDFGFSNDVSVSIYDIMGREILRVSDFNNPNALSVDVSSLSNGVYIVNLTDGQQTINKRIIKE
jgi:hypothetical protein